MRLPHHESGRGGLPFSSEDPGRGGAGLAGRAEVSLASNEALGVELAPLGGHPRFLVVARRLSIGLDVVEPRAALRPHLMGQLLAVLVARDDLLHRTVGAAADLGADAGAGVATEGDRQVAQRQPSAVEALDQLDAVVPEVTRSV